MKKLLAIISIVYCSFISNAQECNCKLNFEALVNQVKPNYAGFNDKVNAKNLTYFNDFTSKLQNKAANVKAIDSCYVILKTWTNFFKDRHLRVQLGWRYREKFPEKVKEINKQFPKRDLPPAAQDKLSEETSITILENDALLFRLPSFEWSEKKKIDSLITNYKSTLKDKPYWVIDLRGNAGGTDYAYNSLLPYLYTNPIKVKPDEYWASDGNINILKENLSDTNLPEGNKQFLSSVIKLMENNKGKFVNPSGKDFFLTTLDSVYKYPKKIAILIDRNSESSAETFLLNAKQSKKVILFGENSAGVLDYSNTQYFDLPQPDFKLVAAISRSKRLPLYPIDNIGIAPDVKITNDTPDKLKVILKKLKSKK
ncbi:hypothetical protein EZ428_09725 [Pedobacter frigiditerrae]|uniref:Tail specific protease domain-containing protein n=1 Tax=Pedobacter frigiditerrae TaxID=2530452 RepID=A0A4R0N149_9SPHI|nr:S41 family peptidase [Pedobacter frigiditerrae]TCC92004.1 hypothetical protein EZ428_09725 [Pedobacter frigiditerrae]